MHDVEGIMVRPHAMGMPDHDPFVTTSWTPVALGLKPQLQTTTAVGTRYQEGARPNSLMPGASTAGKAVLLVVHYDGVEAGPAAADDGAGCAALLETLRASGAQGASRTTSRSSPMARKLAARRRLRPRASWAKDVAFIMNFEARGTTGRSYMLNRPGQPRCGFAITIGGRRDGGFGIHDDLPRAPQRHRPVELRYSAPALNFALPTACCDTSATTTSRISIRERNITGLRCSR
jgi:hypothetical protein